jgi:lipopolysaccharide export LptBFGC system permease protein LptF
LNGQALTQQEEEELLTTGERDYLRQQREFNQKSMEYQDDRVDYHRNVFVIASVLGVAAVAAGLYLFRRVEAMPLGLVLGGLGVVIFGWAQAAEDFGEIGMAPLFAVVGVGLAIVLAAGYWLLGTREAGEDGG